MIQLDAKTIAILKAIEAEKETHFRGLMKATGVGQNALNPRINKLKRAGRVKERQVGQRRLFSLTAKGYQALKDHYAARGAEFQAFLQMTAEGRALLENMRGTQKRQEAEIAILKVQLAKADIRERIKRLQAEFEELRQRFEAAMAAKKEGLAQVKK